MQSVPGLGAQHSGCLLLLEVLDEGHGSIGAGQVVTSWGRKQREMSEGYMENREKDRGQN